jgi:A/G-specific adenine glycosylase
MKSSARKESFVRNLLQWNRAENKREMPWKGEKDPYRIWLSEIILQQTRVEQGLNYYHRFISTFPTVHDLAGAPETTVFKLWEGLGYYSRCKNLISSSKYISEVLGGKFPETYEDMLSLKGVGPYTAAAIASFAFNLPHAVVDGNVYRVLARYFGIASPIDSTLGKSIFSKLADDLVPKQTAGIYNQALMDFGATVCKPQLPLCDVCPLNNECLAFQQKKVLQLPVKEKSIARKSRWFNYLVIEVGDKVYIRKRGAGDIWENLYEFVLYETMAPLLPGSELVTYIKSILGTSDFQVVYVSNDQKQVLTHQTIRGQFIKIKIKEIIHLKGYESVAANSLAALPFPKFISNFLKDKNVSLNLV